MDSHSKILVFSVILLLVIAVSFPWAGAADEDMSSLGLADAEDALNSAYDAAFEAEAAGANISGLLEKLSVGSEYLSAAFVSHRLDNYEDASRYASLSSEAVVDVVAEADALRSEAQRAEEADFNFKLVASIFGVAVVVIVGFVVWRVFRRRYFRRVLGLKPEVVSSES
jgi:hypothetical protein